MSTATQIAKDAADTVLNGVRKGQDAAHAGFTRFNEALDKATELPTGAFDTVTGLLPEPKKVVDVFFDLTKTVVDTQVELGRTVLRKAADVSAN